jgi:hypothetical protein
MHVHVTNYQLHFLLLFYDCLRETRLRIKCQTPEGSDPEQVQKTARVLEQLLFKQANQNLKTYMDKSTLDGRLRSLMTVLVRRKMIMNQSINKSSSSPSSSSRKHHRSVMLQRMLGRERYLQVRDLVRQIQITKMKKAMSLQCGTGRYGVMICGKTFGENLPAIIRRLYFETTLLQAFETYDLKRIQKEVCWELLIEQARENLRNFKEWEAGGGVMDEVLEGYR